MATMIDVATMKDDPVAQALAEYAGTYVWGKRDCISLLSRIYFLAKGEEPETSRKWLALAHDRAVKKAQKKFGSLEACYTAMLDEHMERADSSSAQVLILTQPHTTTLGIYIDPEEQSHGAVLAFRTGYGEVWAFTPQGLAQIMEPIRVAAQWRF